LRPQGKAGCSQQVSIRPPAYSTSRLLPTAQLLIVQIQARRGIAVATFVSACFPSSVIVMKIQTNAYIGRHQQMRALAALLEDALSGSGKVIMLEGDPGIGKTRTAQELSSIAQTLGALTLWGKCYEGQGAPSYWPWLQSLRSCLNVDVLGPERFVAYMGQGATDVAEILPELRQLLPHLQPRQGLDPNQARFQLFESIATFFKNLSWEQPVALVLDDLHWADRPTLALLQFFAHAVAGNPLAVIGTYREHELSRAHPLLETLAQISREPSFYREPLRGLGIDDVAQLTFSVLGREPSYSIVRAVYSQTEGNPFFVKEIARLLEHEEETWRVDADSIDITRIPAGIREVVGERLNRLSGTCNYVLTVAAVVGREFESPLLERLLREDLEETEILNAIEEGFLGHVIEEVGGGTERYQFTHALIHQTLLSDLSPGRRARLHARIAEAIEEMYSSRINAHAAELAHHCVAAQSILDPQKLVRYSLMAGNQALEAYAYEDALTHFEKALAAREGDTLDAEMAEILFGLGQAQIAMFRVKDATGNLRRAWEYFIASGQADRALTIARYSHCGYLDLAVAMGDLAERSLEIVPPDSPEAALFFAAQAYALGFTKGGFDSARMLFEKALDIVRSHGNQSLEADILPNLAITYGLNAHWQEALETCLPAIELANRMDNLKALSRAKFFAGNSYLYGQGNVELARKQHLQALEIAEKTRDLSWIGRTAAAASTVPSFLGEWETALSLNARGLAFSPNNPILLAKRMILAGQQGDLQEGQACLDQVVQLIETEGTMDSQMVIFALPFMQHISGVPVPEEWLESLARSILSQPHAISLYTVPASAALALMAIERNDAEAAREQYEALIPQKGTMIYMFSLAFDRLLGLLAQTMGQRSEAINHFEDALAFCRQAGYLPELAWSCYAYAITLSSSNEVEDARKAKLLLEEAKEISREIGMKILLERVLACQQRLEAGKPRVLPYPDGLSHRELEVLRLVAAGKSNPQIAQELCVSVKTVGNHVSSILNKTNTTNRSEAAAYAVRRDLI
jgi:DNA-binding CsgD family transcriptional regulator/tetratricopeptide (TPR) repeat protein